MARKQGGQPIHVVVAEVAAPEPVPLSERLARALFPVILRRRLEGLVPGPVQGAEQETAGRVTRPPPSPPPRD